MGNDVNPSNIPPSATSIGEEQINGLASIGATEQDICDYLGITPQQLEAQYGALLRRRWAWFRIILRQKQFNIATQNKGDMRMLQWLGRFNLSQTTLAPIQPTTESPVKTYAGIDPDSI